MKAKGNGVPEQCAINLLLISRGEVPYSRIKGRDASVVDAPASTAIRDAEADAEWLIERYEPRMNVDAVNVSDTLADVGEFGINASISARKDDEI